MWQRIEKILISGEQKISMKKLVYSKCSVTKNTVKCDIKCLHFLEGEHRQASGF